MKYRWLDSEKLVCYRGKSNPRLRGRSGKIVVLPTGAGVVGNVLVDFDGVAAVCPAGTLRKIK